MSKRNRRNALRLRESTKLGTAGASKESVSIISGTATKNEFVAEPISDGIEQSPSDVIAGLRYEDFLKQRTEIAQLELSNSERFDKAVLQLAAGALVLTVTFINQIAPNPERESQFPLFLGWSGLGLSIVFVLLSLLVAQFACRREVKLLEVQQIQSQTCLSDQVACPQRNWYTKATLCLNLLGGFAFVLGIGGILVFSGMNIQFGELPDRRSPATLQDVSPELLNEDGRQKDAIANGRLVVPASAKD